MDARKTDLPAARFTRHSTFRSVTLSLLAGLAGAATACSHGAPPTPAGIDAAVSPLPSPSAALADARTPDASAASTVANADAGAPHDAGASGATASASAPDAGDPGALPQTRDKPKGNGEGFEKRAALLFDAIVADDPDRAIPFFFPVTAYEQVKAIAYPASDWRRRLIGAFKRDIHGLHKRLGDKAASAKLVRFDVPDDRARWVEPDEESNKLGYWRVYGTHIVYEVDGKERTFDVSSLISWRGEWYVVHLTGFK